MNSRRTRIACLVVLLMCVCAASPAVLAHKPSDSYLRLEVSTQTIAGQWDIALRDLNHALVLDTDGDGAITWGELKARHRAIAAYALSRLQLTTAGRKCLTEPSDHLVDYHSDGAYAVLRFTATCPREINTLAVGYSLLFDLDPRHRGLINVTSTAGTTSAVLGPADPVWRLDIDMLRPWRQLVDFGRDGVWHISNGIDHILFLFTLLFPVVLRRSPGAWQAVDTFGAAFVEAAKIVTAFTLAHSLTLGLAVLGAVDLPARLVESAIAASIVVVALNNIWPCVTRRVWLAAFGFGLIHGLGFASVLIDLDLPPAGRLLALAGFNLGVEAGQLAIVALFLPVVYSLRTRPSYGRRLLPGVSCLIALIAGLWFIQRLPA